MTAAETTPFVCPDSLTLQVTFYTGRFKPKGKAAEITWAALVERLSRHAVRTGKDGPLWSPARLDPQNIHRANANVRGVSAIAGDVDDFSDPDELLVPLEGAGIEHLAYTSHGHAPDHSKYRFAVPLTREVSPAEFPAVWRGFVALYGRGHLDLQCSDSSRAYYEPTTIPKKDRDWEPWVRHHRGRALDPDELIAAAPAPAPATTHTEQQAFPSNGHRPAADKILTASLKSTEGKDRHYRGYHLARQLQANHYTESEAESVVLALQRRLEEDGDHKYTEREALASLAAAYKKTALAPWEDRSPSSDSTDKNSQHTATNGAAPVGSPFGIDDVIRVFRKWLHLPDDGSIKVALAAYAANRITGDPIWLMIVGAPGSGKTEVLNAMSRLPHVCANSSLSGESALLSGTSKREKAAGASGGLLREIGEFGVLLLKDFTSILGMKHEQRAALLAALREIYDGSWVRRIGVDGGKVLSWAGKLGFIAGCTPIIDSHHAVIGAMGERFAFYRLPITEAEAQARRALQHYGREKEMRKELSDSVTALFAGIDFQQQASVLSEADNDLLVELASLAARCRSAVERDPYTRKIIQRLDPEAPARLAVVLRGLLQGLIVIGVPRDEAWGLVTRVAVDSMPALRWSVLSYAISNQYGVPIPTPKFEEVTRHPYDTVRRALEDLWTHDVLVRSKAVGRNEILWELSPWTAEKCACLARLFRKLPQWGVEGSSSSSSTPSNTTSEEFSEKSSWAGTKTPTSGTGSEMPI